MSTIAAIIGRILLAAIFVVSGIGKFMDIAGTEAMITAAGLPGGLAIPAGAFEILAGLALALGLATRLVSTLLFGFVALATAFFHNRFNDPAQMIMALKNLAIMGGLLMVFAHSQMWWSWDSMRRERKSFHAVRSVERERDENAIEAERRIHEAELRAARAEGRAEAVQGAGAVPVVADQTVIDSDGDGVPETRTRRWWQ
ncbi:MAG: DoxX family protein [Novosphingobium sp.]